MSKLSSEMKVMRTLVFNMILNGTNDDEKKRVKDYISKLHMAEEAEKTNNIEQLKKKHYYNVNFGASIDISDSLRRRAVKMSKEIIDEAIKGETQ